MRADGEGAIGSSGGQRSAAAASATGAGLPSGPGCLVYITAATEEEARRIGRAMVERRLAACANVVPAIGSYYWWEGRLVEDGEALLLLKTLPEAVGAVMQAVRELHSYRVPAISVVPLSDLNPAYLAWMREEIRLPAGDLPAGQKGTGGGGGKAGS